MSGQTHEDRERPSAPDPATLAEPTALRRVRDAIRVDRGRDEPPTRRRESCLFPLRRHPSRGRLKLGRVEKVKDQLGIVLRVRVGTIPDSSFTLPQSFTFPPEGGRWRPAVAGRNGGSMSEDRKQPELTGMPSQPPHGGHCTHCGALITADTLREWHRKVRQPCPRCGRPW